MVVVVAAMFVTAEYRRGYARTSSAYCFLGAAPLSHVLGSSGVMNPAILTGAGVALMSRFDAGAALDLMRESGTTVLLGVPTMCIALLQAAGSSDDLPALRIVHAGGASLSPELVQAVTTRFGCEVLEGYGMTEAAGVVATHRTGQRCKLGSVQNRPTESSSVSSTIAATPSSAGRSERSSSAEQA